MYNGPRLRSVSLLSIGARVTLSGGLLGTVVGHGHVQDIDNKLRLVYIISLDEVQQNADHTMIITMIVADPSSFLPLYSENE